MTVSNVKSGLEIKSNTRKTVREAECMESDKDQTRHVRDGVGRHKESLNDAMKNWDFN